MLVLDGSCHLVKGVGGNVDRVLRKESVLDGPLGVWQLSFEGFRLTGWIIVIGS